MPVDGGPYLQIAALCERVLQERDGVLSLIRVIDRLNVGAAGSEAPDKMPPTSVSCWSVVSLKSGFMQGSYNLKLVPRTPSDRALGEANIAVLLEGNDRGINVVTQINFLAEEDGLYWIDVLFENALLTRMPLRLVYQRLSGGLPLPGAQGR